MLFFVVLLTLIDKKPEDAACSIIMKDTDTAEMVLPL